MTISASTFESLIEAGDFEVWNSYPRDNQRWEAPDGLVVAIGGGKVDIDWTEVAYVEKIRVGGIVFEGELEGGEGEGDFARGIFKGENGQFFVKDGWYQSYDGMYLDGDLYEAEPYERIVIDYRPIGSGR